MGEKNLEYSIFYEQTWEIPVNNGFHNIPTELLRLIMRKKKILTNTLLVSFVFCY